MTAEEYQAMLDSLKAKEQPQKDPDWLQRLYNYSQRFVNDPQFAARAMGTMIDPTQGLNTWATPLYNQMRKPESTASEYGSALGEQAGQLAESVVPGLTKPGTFERAGASMGRALPNMLTTAPLALAGPAALPLMVGKSEMDAYGSSGGDPISGLAGGLGTAVGGALVPAGAGVLGAAAKKWLLPSVGELVGAETSQAFGQGAAKALQTAVDPASAQLVNAARTMGGVAGGTVAGEGSRQAESLMRTGDVAPLDTAALIGDVGTNVAFAVPHIANMMGKQPGVRMTPTGPALEDPYSTTGELVGEAAKRVTLAQAQRTMDANQRAEYDSARGARIGQAHQDIFNAFETGQDPTPLIGALKAHWDEATPVPTPSAGLQIMKSVSDNANIQGIDDESFHRIVAGVQGRYGDMFKADPTRPGPEILNELVKRQLLPKLTKEWVNENFSDALQQTLGDTESAKTNLVNRIAAHYEERLPAAMEAMRALPVESGLSRQALNAQTEADKDAAYVNAIIKLYPHMKDAKTPDGQSLAQALYARDMDMSAATQGTQLQASSTAWSKYDAWKTAVIKMADTYDPQTRQGTFLPTKRLSDGSMIELPAQKTSIEDMVAKEGSRYTFDVTPTRKMNRAGSSSALRDAIEFVGEKFKPADQVEEDISNVSNPEDFVAKRKEMIKSNVDEEVANVDLPAIEADADEQGLTGKQREDFIAAQSQPALGVDLAQSPEGYYDVALHLMNKVDKATNAELWDKYGGERLFGKGAKSPGKFGLFKDAVMARMESEMDDTGQLSVAQKTFYEKWAKNAADKSGGQAPLAKTWEEQRGQFKHALRLYWGTHSPVSMPDLFMSMLDDKPKYQQMLARAKTGDKTTMSLVNEDTNFGKSWGNHWPHGMWLDPQGRIIANKTGHMETGIEILGSKIEPQSRGDYDDADFDEIFGGMEKKGYVQLRGNDGRLTVISPGLTRIQRAALERYGIEHNSAVYDYHPAMEGKPIYEPPASTQLAQTQPSDNANASVTFSGFRTPLVDAVRIGRGFGRQVGLDDATSDELGIVLGKAVQIFDEVAGYGKMITDSPNTMGGNTASQIMGGPTATVNLEGIMKDELEPIRAVVKMLQTTAHELAHNYSDHNMAAFGPFRQQRSDAYSKLRAMLEDIGPDAANDLLNKVLPEVLLPPNLQNLTQPSLVGQDFGQEAVSRFMEHVMLGVLTKDNPWQVKGSTKYNTWGEATKWLPDEVQAVMHLAMRDMTNVIGAVKQYYKTRPYQKGDMKVMNYLQPMLAFANEYIDTNAAQLAQYRTIANDMMSGLTLAGSKDWEDPTMVFNTLDTEPAKLQEMVNASKIAYSKVDPKDVLTVQKTMFGSDKPIEFEHEKRLGKTVPPWSRYMGLFFQAMRRYQKTGVGLAEDAMRMVNDLEPSYFRLTRLMHDPFLATDEKGRLVYDPKNPVLAMLQKSTPDAVRGRAAVNELYLWANQHGKPVVIRDQSGQITVSPEASPLVKQKIGHLPMTIQQGVLQGLADLVDGYKQASDIAYHSHIENTGSRMAALFMTIDKGMYHDAAFKIGKQVTEASVGVIAAKQVVNEAKKDPLLLPQATAALQQAQAVFNQSLGQLQTDQVAVVNQYMFGNDGLAQKLVDLDAFFKKRQDWFGSESRPGKIFIVSTMQDGTKHYTSAANETEAKKVMKELVGQGNTHFQFIDKSQRGDFDLFQSPDAVVESFQKLEEQAWKTFLFNMKEKLSPEDADYLDKLGYVPGAASEKYIQNKAVDRYMKKRELLPGRERLDAFDVFRDYTSRMSGSVARKSLRSRLDLLLKDPRVRYDGQFKDTVNSAMDSLMTPINERFVAARAGMTAYFLGMPNLVGPIVEGTQSSTTILPYLVDEVGFAKGVTAYTKALARPGILRNLGKDFESRRLLQSASDKDGSNPGSMTKEESEALYYKRANEEGGFQYGPIYSATLSRDHQLLTQQAFGLGKSTPKTREQLVTDPIYWLAQKSMYLYSHLSAYNSRIAFLSAIDTQYDKGLRGQQLYQAARAFQNVATFGGGKANSIGFVNKLSNPTTRSAFSLIESLQRYTFGQATMYKDFIADMLGNTDLKPEERKKAAKALGTATLAQFLLGGAMAIPGMAIGAGIIKALTGEDPKQALRSLEFHIAQALRADDEMAVTAANYAQNGLVSNALGVDLSNRVSNNSILGFNQFDGFDASGMFGATGGMIQRMVDATKHVAEGKYVEAGKTIAPPSWSPYFDLGASKLQYGNFALRDQSSRMIQPLSNTEAATYALGLRPQKYRQIRDQQEALKTSEDQYKKVRDTKLDDLSQKLLQGNSKAVWDHIQQSRQQDPTILPQGTARSVIDRAVESSQPQDLLAQGVTGNEQSQHAISATFGDVAPRQSEVQRLIEKERLNAQLGGIAGRPAGRQEFEHAAMIDALVNSKGLTRGEAERMVGLMGY